MAFHITSHDVSRETFDQLETLWINHQQNLERYVDLLLSANQKVNLISRKLEQKDVVKHVQHSILPSLLFDFANPTVWDAGTGGGLPGIPLALLFPDTNFILHDKSSKKIRVINEFIDALSLTNCTTRLEDLNNISDTTPLSVISKHSFKLDDFLKRARKLNWSELIFLKGAGYSEELPRSANFNCSIEEYALDMGGAFYREKFILRIF